MAQASVNGAAVVKGSVVLPARGAWIAELELDADDTLPTGQHAATLDLGSQSLTGTVATDRQGVYAGKLTARLVGGGNGLATILTARKYRGVPLSIPLTDILNETGERLSSTSASATLTYPLPHWARARGPASSALECLLTAAGATWRILPDGALWVGVNTYPAATFDGEVIEERHGGSWKLLSPNSGTLLPATTLFDRQVNAVVYRIASDSFKAEAWS